MRGLRLGMGLSRSGGAAFNPLSLSPSLWLDASDMSSLYQTTDTSTPVTAAADPIGRASDKSGAARHFLQATGAARPAFRVTSGKNAINPDGVDDALATAAGQTWPASLDVFIVMSNAEADASLTLLDGGANYMAAAISGDAGTAVADLGTGSSTQYPPVYANNVSAATRTALHTATAGGACKVVELRGIDLATNWGTLSTGLSAGAPFSGRYHEILIYPALSAGNRTTVRDYLTTKWGVA